MQTLTPLIIPYYVVIIYQKRTKISYLENGLQLSSRQLAEKSQYECHTSNAHMCIFGGSALVVFAMPGASR